MSQSAALEDTARLRQARRARLDRTARARLVVKNLGLVVSIARRYEHLGVDLPDLVQEGNIGLMIAVDRFDPHLGKLSSYACWWIRQRIVSAIANQARTVRLPEYVFHALDRVNKARRDLRQALGRDPELEELAARMRVAPTRLAWILENDRADVSTDAPVGRSELRLADLVEDPGAVDPFDAALASQRAQRLEGALATLKPREATVLRRRFGFDVEGTGEQSLSEIGRAFGVTRERVRQIEAAALDKLRSSGAADGLRALVGV
jgi:RNA polymerase primary sigma factor